MAIERPLSPLPILDFPEAPFFVSNRVEYYLARTPYHELAIVATLVN
jgi:hypothetical protein